MCFYRPLFLAQTPVTITVFNGLTASGADKIHLIHNTTCRLEEKTEVITLADGRKVQSIGKIFLFEDIATDLPVITGGKVELLDKAFQICKFDRQRDGDGNFNHAVVRLM